MLRRSDGLRGRVHRIPPPFTEPILRQSLAQHANLDDLLDAVYERVRARLHASPAEYEFHYIQVAALLTRL